MMIYLYKLIQKMSIPLHIGIWVCWELTQCIKDPIKEYNEISSFNLHNN